MSDHGRGTSSRSHLNHIANSWPRRMALPTVLALSLALTLAALPTAALEQRPATVDVEGFSAVLPDDRIADLAASLDYDVDKIYRFVADEIRYEPYDGILRGAVGTLVARAGNALDQSLLLAALLDESLMTVRFAEGQLDADAIAQMAGAALSVDAAATDDLDVLTADAVEVMGAQSSDILARGGDSEPLADDSDALSEHGEKILAEAQSELDDAVATIEDTLAAEGIEPASQNPSLLGMSETGRHIWVQLASGADWLDLDPSIPGSAIGTSFSVPEQTFDAVPDDRRHRISFEVVVERVAGSSLVQDTALEFSGYVDELVGTEITFGHVTPSGMERLGLALGGMLGAARLEYVPFFDVGAASTVADEAVTFGVGGDRGGLFEDSGLFESDTPDADEVRGDGEATAEWLEVAVTSPGLEPVVARRTVFDRVPAEIRFGQDLSPADVQDVELVDVDGSGIPEFLPLLGTKTFAVASGPTPVVDVIRRAGASQAQRAGVASLAYHALRDLIASEVAFERGVRTFLDGPNVMSVSNDMTPSGSEFRSQSVLDVWHRSIATMPSGNSPATVNGPIFAGVLSQVAEQVALTPDDGASSLDGDAAIGVGEVFASARDSGVPIIALHDSAPSTGPYGARANALIASALSKGHAVVIPALPVSVNGTDRVGWWQVDTVTGTTFDVMDTGGGSQEYPVTVTPAIRISACALYFTPFVYPFTPGEDSTQLKAKKGAALGLVNIIFLRLVGKGAQSVCAGV